MSEKNSERDDEFDPDDMPDGDPLRDQLDRNQACKFLSCSMSKLRRLEDKGRITPLTPPNQKAYFALRDLQRLRAELNAEDGENTQAIVREADASPASATVAAAHVASNAVSDMVQTATSHTEGMFKLALHAMNTTIRGAESQNAGLQKENLRLTARIEVLETKLDEQRTVFEDAQRKRLTEEDLAEKREFNQKMIMRGVTMLQALAARYMNPVERGKTQESAVGMFVASLTEEQQFKLMGMLTPDQQAMVFALMKSAEDQETSENAPATP